MQDKDLMENELLVVKGVCDLYLHGAIELPKQKIMKNLLIKWIFIYECLNKYNSIL